MFASDTVITDTFGISKYLALLVLFILLLGVRLIDAIKARGDREALNSLKRYRRALEGANEGVFEWDLVEGRILASERAFEIVGLLYNDAWQALEDWSAVIPEAEIRRIASQQPVDTASSTPFRLSTSFIDKRGETIHLQWQGSVEVSDDGNEISAIGSISDISEQKNLEMKLAHDAMHDFLTGLPNRSLLIDRIYRVLKRLIRKPDATAAILFIDIDNFKTINDNLGHGAGDALLISLAERLRGHVRSSDTVARVGGDEFVLLLEDLRDEEQAQSFADRLSSSVRAPVDIHGHTVIPSVSTGICMVNDSSTSVETLLGDADIAMHTAKNEGRGKVVVFESNMRVHARKRLEVEIALHKAIENQELFLVFQPIFDIQAKPGYAVGAEALLRWQGASQQDIAPSELLAHAEENGMIEQIGNWVIHSAARQLAAWRTEGYPESFYVNVNLTANHFENETIIQTILNALDPAGLPRNSLRIEIVESALIKNPEKALRVINVLQSQGILVSIDDFGTGFSSLSYLHRFPFDALKIDRSFVMDIAQSKASRDIVTAIIIMAHRLGIKVVAEGIETESQLRFLQSAGCEYGQGYLMAKPVEPSGVTAFLKPAPAVTEEIELGYVT
ncbi:MAG: EAL domain-containing protein [Pseudomonadales bacterium]|nr:EAL domain-containing protein [Pseudomonadales bacterium]